MADNITIKDGAGANVVMATDDRAGVNYSKIAGYDEVFDKLMVGTARDKLRDEFFTFDTTNTWELIQTGAGQTVTVAGAANGARYLNVATGVTTNSETIILSRDNFKLPVKLAFALSMSQRIANQEVFVELVGVDATTGAVETNATFPSTNLNNASNAAALKFDGTVVTTASYITRGFAVSELASAGTVFTGSTTVATGTGPNFIPASIYEVNGDMEEVVWNTRAIDSLAAVQVAVKRTQNLPDPGKDYKVRVRVRNLGTAPASTTDVRLHFVRVLDTTRFTVDMARHMGRTTDIADSIPTAITNSPAVTVTSGAVTATPGVPATQYAVNSAASTNAALILTGTSGLQALFASNQGGTDAFVKLYNKATAPVAGTDTPLMVIRVPANSQVELTPGFSGYRFPLGLGIAITGLAADTDTTAVGAGQIKVNISRTA